MQKSKRESPYCRAKHYELSNGPRNYYIALPLDGGGSYLPLAGVGVITLPGARYTNKAGASPPVRGCVVIDEKAVFAIWSFRA